MMMFILWLVLFHVYLHGSNPRLTQAEMALWTEWNFIGDLVSTSFSLLDGGMMGSFHGFMEDIYS
jgi:hypothetical protein